jgi:hypothetical protein
MRRTTIASVSQGHELFNHSALGVVGPLKTAYLGRVNANFNQFCGNA